MGFARSSPRQVLLLAGGDATLAGMPWLWLAAATACLGHGFYMLHNTLRVHATQMAPKARGLSVSLSFLFAGQSLGVALGAPVVDRFGARAVFATAAILLLSRPADQAYRAN